jgi:phosphatidylserine/phosphatidylglycerophosphate/cardiolipin synthase-like enzyme
MELLGGQCRTTIENLLRCPFVVGKKNDDRIGGWHGDTLFHRLICRKAQKSFHSMRRAIRYNSANVVGFGQQRDAPSRQRFLQSLRGAAAASGGDALCHMLYCGARLEVLHQGGAAYTRVLDDIDQRTKRIEASVHELNHRVIAAIVGGVNAATKASDYGRAEENYQRNRRRLLSDLQNQNTK